MMRKITLLLAWVTGCGAVVVACFLLSLWLLDLRDRREQVLQALVLRNSERLSINESIDPDPAKARVTDGIGLARTALIPKSIQSILRIQLRAQVQADRPNTAVIAVFRDGNQEPVHVFTKKLSGPRLEEMSDTFDMPPHTGAPMILSFRIGPAEPSAITLNGTASGGSGESLVVVEEIKPAGLR